MAKKPTYEELEQKVKELEKEREVIAVGRDISEQKKVIKALMETANKYRNIIEGIEESYFEVDIAV
jgi:hypothetical protein